MPSERDLRRRVRSIKNIQQLTRAMQLVAASKMRRAQEAVLASRPFEEKLRSVLNELAPYADPELSPLLARREVVQDGPQLLLERTRRQDRLLGAAHLRRGHELHRPSELLDVLDRPDAPA